MKQLPHLYFRIRDNGALVFRLDTENRHRRLDMEHVATINLAKGDVKPQGDRKLTEAEVEAIRDWIDARRATLQQREDGTVRALLEQMNLVTQWVQTRADDTQVEAVSEDLLMAMHDLRATLVRRKADSLKKAAE